MTDEIKYTKSQEIFNKAKEAGIVEEKDFIKFKGTGKHIVKFINDKAISGTNFKTGQPEEKVRYIFEENGKEKNYETAIFRIDQKTKEKKLGHFIQSMSQFEYGDMLEMEYKPIPGTPRGFIDIKKVNEPETTEDQNTSDNIPVIEEDSEPKKIPEEDLNVDELPF